MAPSILGGAMTGAGTGFSVGGPWGAGVGAIVGGVAGAFSGANADQAGRAARTAANDIPLTDPAVTAHIERARRIEANQRAGTDATSAFSTNTVRNVLAQTQDNIRRAAGGNAATGISGALSAQNNANQSIAAIGADAGRRADALMGYQGGLITDQSRRKRELMEFTRNQAYAEYEARRQNISNTMQSGLGLLSQFQLTELPNFREASMFGGSRAGASWGAPAAVNPSPATGYNAMNDMMLPPPDPYRVPSAALDQNLTQYGF